MQRKTREIMALWRKAHRPAWIGALVSLIVSASEIGVLRAEEAAGREPFAEFAHSLPLNVEFALAALAVGVAAWGLSVRRTRRRREALTALTGSLKEMIQGGGDVALPGLGRADEVGALARAAEGVRLALISSREREWRLAGIMASIDEAIVIIAENGTIERHNAAAERLFGCVPDGRGFLSLFGDGDRARLGDMLEAVLADREPGEARRAEAVGVAREGTWAEVSVSLTSLTVQGRRNVVAVLADITERLRQQRELMRLATRDRLTGLPNRALSESLLEAAVERSRREGRVLAVLCLDLSRFKLITDTLGHRAGELLLLEVARRIQATVSPGDAVGRVGGDDFAVILDGVESREAAAEVARRILGAFDEPVRLLGTEHFVRPSVGIAVFPDHAGDAQELIRAADTALYAAKRRGGRQLAFYEHEMGDQARRHLELDRELRQALVGGRFEVHYQPKVSLVDFSVEGFEALLRWNKPGVGLVTPGDFIQVAEETGFIVPLGDWVLDEVCRQIRAWIDEGLEPLPVAVNISPRHLRQRTAEDFARALAAHHTPHELIEVEITESAVMHDLDHAMAVLEGLKTMGIRVAVDDFGTGHSSLSYLKRLPVSTLKIDRSFIDGVPKARADAGIVSTIISMADMLRLSVVAEGVERPEQAHFLRHHNCTLVQGWLTGRPIPAAGVAGILEQRLRQRA